MPFIVLIVLMVLVASTLVGAGSAAVGLPFWAAFIGSGTGYLIGLTICVWLSSLTGPLSFTELLFSKI